MSLGTPPDPAHAQASGGRDACDGPGGLVTLGETMGLVSQAEPGRLAHSREMRLSVGGAESNVAIGVRRLGSPAVWIGRVGRDEIGDLILRELHAEGVRTLAVRDDAPTGIMLKTRRTPDLSTVQYYRRWSAGSRLCPADVPEQPIRDAGMLHVTGITPALGDEPAAAVHAAIDAAASAGVPVSLDLNYRSALWRPDRAAAVLRDLVCRADVVFAGADEAELLLPRDDPHRMAAGLVGMGPSAAIIKLGAQGCVARIDGESYSCPALPAVVVDTVGAGDAFVAGYLAGMLAGEPADARLATAVAAGALVVAGHGDWENMPTRDELLLLRRSDPVTR